MSKPELLPWSITPLMNPISSSLTKLTSPTNAVNNTKKLKLLKIGSTPLCKARRKVRYEDPEDEDAEMCHNEEISLLELYSNSSRKEALIIHAVLDDQEVQVLVFKGFTSSLSFGTASDPSRNVLPSRAVIKSIDRVKGPFDPSNIEYLEKGLTWEDFKGRLSSA